MGMFDTVLLLDVVRCPVCGHAIEGGFQFKCYLGDYEPDMRSVEVGEQIPGFPRIPKLEVPALGHCRRGTAAWTADGHFVTVTLAIERGAVTSWGNARVVESDLDYEVELDLPEPRSKKKLERRRAAALESIRREREAAAAWLKAHPDVSFRGLLKSHFAPAWERHLFQPLRLPIYTRFLGNYGKGEDGKWVKLRGLGAGR